LLNNINFQLPFLLQVIIAVQNNLEIGLWH